MPNVVTLRLDADLVNPLLKALEDRAQALRESDRILEEDRLDHGWGTPTDPTPDPAELHARLLAQVREQLARQ